MLYMAVTNYRIYLIMSHTFVIKTSDTRSRSTHIEPRERLSQKISQTLFELLSNFRNLDVSMKNLIRAATELVESRLFRRQPSAFSEGKTGRFQKLDLNHEAIDNPNYRSLSIRPQKLKNNPTFQSASGCADPKIAQDIPRRPVNFFSAEYENYLQHFPQKVL